MSENVNAEKDKNQLEESFALGALLLDYLANWKWFVLSVTLCAIGAFFYISTIIPTYEVTASIYLNGEDANFAKQAVSLSDATMFNNTQFLDETELELMKSRNNMMRVVDSLDLYYSYAEVGRFRNMPLYKDNPISVKLDTPYIKKLDKEIKLKVTNGNSGSFNISVEGLPKDQAKIYNVKSFPDTINLVQGPLIVTRNVDVEQLANPMQVRIMPQKMAAARISGGMSIQYAENSFTVVRIKYNTPIVKEGQDVINAMIKFYNDDIIADKNRAALQTEAFIVERLAMIADSLKSVETQLEQYKRQNNAINLQSQTQMEMAQKQAAESEIVTLRAERELLVDERNHIQGIQEYAPIYSVGVDPTINSKIDEYNQKVRSYEKLENLTDENAQKRELKEALPQLKRGILSAIGQRIKDYDRQISAKMSQAGQAATNIQQDPTKDKGLQEIFRDQQVKVNIYTFLLQKREDIALQKNLATPTARLIDDPTGSGPVAPKKSMIYALALLIGLAIPAAFIYLRRMIYPVFKDKTELERVTKVPILSEICKLRKPTEIAVTQSGTTTVDELFRLLRNNIQFVLGTGKVMMVMSSLSGEGKTFVSTNIALSFAFTGKRTLVIGLDIRRPMLAHSFSMNNNEGITTYLSGAAHDWTSMVKQSAECENLYVLPGGPIPPNPNELLLSNRLEKLLNEARDLYDYIVIDSAPIGLVSDSLLIAHLTDVQLYVTRANFSTQRCIKLMHNTINSHRLPHTYLILNGVNMRSRVYNYRSYGRYGGTGAHGYGYGYKFEETPKLSSRFKRVWRKARHK